jgi:hypothetical protein
MTKEEGIGRDVEGAVGTEFKVFCRNFPEETGENLLKSVRLDLPNIKQGCETLY